MPQILRCDRRSRLATLLKDRRAETPVAPNGFTLLEVLVATVIMGIAVTGLIVGLSQSVKNASRLTEYDRAAILARTELNELLLSPRIPFEGTLEGEFDKSSGWRAVSRPFDAPPNATPGTLILQEIALEIWWQPNQGTRRTMRLAGYRQTRIPVPAAP